MQVLKNAIKSLAKSFGYQIVAIPAWSRSQGVVDKDGFRLVSWKGDNDSLDLRAYQAEQEKGNRAKIDQIWTNEGNLRSLCQWIEKRGFSPQLILCHGTRNGFEQRVFHSHFNCEVIGTEISSTASQFPMTIQADFHERRPDWTSRADLVYSNSLDHAYDPAKALRAWADSVRRGGFIVLEKASDSDPHGISDLDPFGISLPNLLLFILQTLGERASIRAVIDVPEPKAGMHYHKMVVVEIRENAS